MEKNNKKIVWGALAVFVAVILCYAFVVLYFFFISPYDISLKTTLWPFLSDKTISQIYLDATMEIDFKVFDEEEANYVDVSTVGVNIRKDGYVVAPCTDFRDIAEDYSIQIKANSGKVFVGKLLHCDTNNNLALLKCENMDGKGEIKLPFAKIRNKNYHVGKVFAISSPLYEKNVWAGKIEDAEAFTFYGTKSVGGFETVDFVVENACSVFLTDDFAGGAIFDKNGALLGLSYSAQLSDGSFAIMPANGIYMFLNDVVKSYQKKTTFQNPLVEKFVGFDALQLGCCLNETTEKEDGKKFFNFHKQWVEVSDVVVQFLREQSGNQTFGFYLINDFQYVQNESYVQIPKDSIISKIVVEEKSYQISVVNDLLSALYSAKEGNNVTIFYESVQETQVQSIQFVV